MARSTSFIGKHRRIMLLIVLLGAVTFHYLPPFLTTRVEVIDRGPSDLRMTAVPQTVVITGDDAAKIGRLFFDANSWHLIHVRFPSMYRYRMVISRVLGPEVVVYISADETKWNDQDGFPVSLAPSMLQTLHQVLDAHIHWDKGNETGR